ncbi:MAG: hypothetical protein J6C81_05065 [Muribaculaceae bacterium]|nr:hypothetical protein [Muribaculaceae bacterium]
MKKILAILIAIVCFSLSAIAAEGEKGNRAEMRKELHEFKMKYLAQEMQLREDQQKRFFELYTAMCDEKHKVFSEARNSEKRLRQAKNATDADYAKASKVMSDAKIKEGEIERRYQEKFAQFLSQKQIFKMKEAEEKFRREMQKMRNKNRKK